MRKLLLLLALATVGGVPLSAQIDALQGYCDLGGTKTLVSGISSTNYANGVIPGCTVEVFLTGTTTHPGQIYSDAAGTHPLSNPFTAVQLPSPNPGYWIFFAATGQGYDVKLSGGNGNPSCTTAPNCYTTPLTKTDLKVGGGGGSGGLTFFSAGNDPPLFNTLVTNPGTTPNLAFTPINQNGQTVFGNFTGASAQPFFAKYACTGLLTCVFNPGSNTWTLDVPNTSSLSITTTDCIKVNGGNGPVSSGTANISQSGCTTPPALRMNQLEDATHVFVPFGQCVFSTSNSSLIGEGSCTALSGSVTFFPGGLFNHNVSADMLWSNAQLPSWLPAGNVTGVSIISNTSGYGAGPISSCGGSGSCGSWVTQNPITQNVVPVTGVTGSNISSLTASAHDSWSTYCGCDGLVGNMTITQVGLLVEFSGVTNPNPSNALNIGYGLAYNSSTNTLSTDQSYPFQIAPVLTSNLPLWNASGYVAWVSDNTQTTSGGACTGSGTYGSDYALCTSTINGWKLLADMGSTGFGVTQITNSDGSLTFSPNTGHVIGSLNTSNPNDWHADQRFFATAELSGGNSPFVFNGDAGTSGECAISNGAGNTPRWGSCGGGGGGLSGQTTNYLPKATSATASTTSSIVEDQGTGIAIHGTSTTQAMFFPPSTGTPSPVTGDSGVGADSSGNAVASDNGGAFSRICTTGNGLCGGGGTYFTETITCTTSCTLTHTPVTFINLSRNGLSQRTTTDFSVSGTTVSLVVAATGGDTFYAQYYY